MSRQRPPGASRPGRDVRGGRRWTAWDQAPCWPVATCPGATRRRGADVDLAGPRRDPRASGHLRAIAAGPPRRRGRRRRRPAGRRGRGPPVAAGPGRRGRGRRHLRRLASGSAPTLEEQLAEGGRTGPRPGPGSSARPPRPWRPPGTADCTTCGSPQPRVHLATTGRSPSPASPSTPRWPARRSPRPTRRCRRPPARTPATWSPCVRRADRSLAARPARPAPRAAGRRQAGRRPPSSSHRRSRRPRHPVRADLRRRRPAPELTQRPWPADRAVGAPARPAGPGAGGAFPPAALGPGAARRPAHRAASPPLPGRPPRQPAVPPPPATAGRRNTGRRRAAGRTASRTTVRTAVGCTRCLSAAPPLAGSAHCRYADDDPAPESLRPDDALDRAPPGPCCWRWSAASSSSSVLLAYCGLRGLGDNASWRQREALRRSDHEVGHPDPERARRLRTTSATRRRPPAPIVRAGQRLRPPGRRLGEGQPGRARRSTAKASTGWTSDTYQSADVGRSQEGRRPAARPRSATTTCTPPGHDRRARRVLSCAPSPATAGRARPSWPDEPRRPGHPRAHAQPVTPRTS